jgi:hypothetical protein
MNFFLDNGDSIKSAERNKVAIEKTTPKKSLIQMLATIASVKVCGQVVTLDRTYSVSL